MEYLFPEMALLPIVTQNQMIKISLNHLIFPVSVGEIQVSSHLGRDEFNLE